MNIKDWRNIENGHIIPTEAGGYCDQPSLLELSDGSWLCSVTTSDGHEGSTAQYVGVTRSFDKGRTWSKLIRLEPMEDGQYWESSYSKLASAPDGTVFCFYCYNDMHILSKEAGVGRVDMGIAFCYRYSRDNGESWSNRIKIPIRDTKVDREMPLFGTKGERVPLFWNVAKVLVKDDTVYVPLSKIGNGKRFMDQGEGVLLKSSDLFQTPDQATWETLPEGEDGILCVEGFDTVCEEHCFVSLSDDSMVCTFRTKNGRSAYALSHDGGKSFAPSALLTYPDGRSVKNSRANNTFWSISNGRYLYWFTNCGMAGYYTRNPAWLCAAVEVDTPQGKQLKLSQPEIVLYAEDKNVGFSYPDMLEGTDCYYISETQKTVARIHEIPKAFVDQIFRQFDETAGGDIKPDAEFTEGTHTMEPLGTVYQYTPLRNGQKEWIMPGLSLDFEVSFEGQQQILFDTVSEMTEGIRIVSTQEGCLEIFITEARENFYMRTESCLCSGRNRVTVVFDFLAGTVYAVVNEQLLDGGENLYCGFKLISHSITNVGYGSRVTVGNPVDSVRVYRKALYVTDCILLQRKACK